MTGFADVLTHAARTDPGIEAVRDDRGARLTYAELAERVERAAGGWRDLGVSDGARVAFVARNSAEFVVQFLSVHRAGGIPALVNWRLSAREIEQLGVLFEPVAVFADEDFAELASGIPVATTVTTEAAVALDGPPPAPSVERMLDDAVLTLIHTSGTTGLPKGVPLTNGSQLRGGLMSSAALPQLEPGARHLRVMPLFHLSGLASALFSLIRHDTLILPERFDPDDILDTIEREGIHFTNAGPSLLRRICDAQEARPRDLSSLLEVWYGTEPIPADVLERSLRLLGCNFNQNYGMTEAQRPVTQLRPDDHRADSVHVASAGRPAMGWELRIVDGEGNDVAEGTPGEVWIRGGDMVPGYWNDPEATAAAFVGPAVPPGLAWYRTGDVGTMVDGYLRVQDRVSDMIISGGENIYPAEVERVLRDHPAIADAAAVARPHERWGETVHAVVVRAVEADGPADGGELLSWCRDRLAHFKCPTSIEFVEELPRNATGKVVRRRLR